VNEARVQRRLAAIAIADVVGYSRLMGQDEAGTLALLNARRVQLIEPQVAAHGGRVVKLLGDGFFIEFSSAVDALEAALAIQAGTAEANAALPADRRMLMRVGINLGEVIVAGEDLFGDGVNVAARLESIAPRGGIAMSASVHEQVRGRVAVEIEDSGERELKNIAAPVHVYSISPLAIGAANVELAPPPVAAPPASAPAGPSSPAIQAAVHVDERPTIAILPFANLGGDPEQAFFSDGISEDLITELSRWRSLRVCSRSASFRYRGMAQDLQEVARELGVRYVVEGSVRRLGERLRITAQLIDAETATHVWAEKFDRPAQDIFAVQDELLRTLVSTLVGRLLNDTDERLRRRPTSSLAAYECLLRANSLAWASREGCAEATRLLERAVAIDPEYGYAHALLSALRKQAWYEAPAGDDRLLDEALALAQRAVMLDDAESSCHALLSHALASRRAFEPALRQMQRAVELNPSNQWNQADMGLTMIHLGRHEEALEWLQRARVTDPYFDVAWYWRGLGQALFMLGRLREALEALARAPGLWRGAAIAAACHAMLGETGQAQARVRDCLATLPTFTVANFMSKEQFAREEDATRLREALLMAGFPP
jgi:TolB-like protein/class 3 adenylate cyclase/Tfp pilus assembly protein PilF